MSLEQKTSYLWGPRKEKIVDIIYRLLHYYQKYFFVRLYLTASYCFRSSEWSRKQIKRINNLKIINLKY